MRRYISLLLGILGFVPILAQQSDYYYYYNGNRVYLTVDSTRLYVVSNGEYQSQSKVRIAEPRIAMSVKSDIHSQVVPLQKQRSAAPEVYFSTLEMPEVQSADQYDALVAKVKAEDEVVQVLPSFTVNGNRVDVTNNFYVRLKSADDLGKLQQMAALHGIEVVGNNEYMPLWYILSCTSTSSMNAIEAANFFYTSGVFESSSPETLIYEAYQSTNNNVRSNDIYFGRQWGLYNEDYPDADINIEEAWEATQGDGVVVAVISDGIDFGHPDLRDNRYSLNYEDNAASSSSSYMQNGTRYAGIIGAIHNNDVGMHGVAPECKLMSVAFNFFNGVSTHKIVTGILWAMNNGADVICLPQNMPNDSLITEAIGVALNEGRNGYGCVLLAGSGNHLDTSQDCQFPRSVDARIIIVGAAMKCGARAQTGQCEHSPILWNSCYGDTLDIIAPGVSVFTTAKSPNYPQYVNDFEGTEAACAHAAGIAALMLSVNPDLTAEAVDFIICKSAHKIRTDLYSYTKSVKHKISTWNNEVGYGFIDAAAAVELAMPTTSYVWEQDIYDDADGYFENTNVDVKNITVDAYEQFHIFKSNGAILRSSVKVKRGGELLIFNP